MLHSNILFGDLNLWDVLEKRSVSFGKMQKEGVVRYVVSIFLGIYWHSLMQTLMEFFSDLNSELIVVIVNLLVMVRTIVRLLL